MIVALDPISLKRHLDPLRARAEPVAFVPTMGNLHAGHLALVAQALETGARVVVSIFVNPMQFAAGEDLDTYPRTLDADLSALEKIGADVVFTPSEADLYPNGSGAHTAIRVPELGDGLCGKDRPGHFDGVCTVVYKLFELVRPDIAIFGEKDLQQLLIIKKMVRDLALPIDIQSGTTQRAEDGLALSSRNQYLSDTERSIAPILWQILSETAQQLDAARSGGVASILAASRNNLVQAGFEVDYLELRALADLRLIDSITEDCALFVAARLGQTRLIDNIQIKAI